jgi:predicted enzyme related to lactoylglutathione lyase
MPLPAEAKAAGAPPNWLTYIYTPDIDETAQEASLFGAKVLKGPADIPTIGRFAVIEDPQGAVFAAIMPEQAPQAETPPALGDFSWHELATTDWRAAFTFYQQLFGWEEQTAMDMGPEMGIYQMFGRNGKMLGGIYNKMSQQQGPPAWLPYIRVPDAKKTAATIKELGAMIANGPMEVPGGDWIVVGADLQGAMFAVHSLKPAVKKPAAKKPPAKAKAKKTRAAKKPAAKQKAAGSLRSSRKPAGRSAPARGTKKKPAKSLKTKATKTKAKPKTKSKPKSKPKLKPKTKSKKTKRR